jgi:hypothetical protein
LSIFETALEPTHPKVLTCRQNCAQLLREMQRQSEAEAIERHAKRARTVGARPKKE